MLLPDMIPYGTSESKEILDAVAAYGADISLVDGVRHEQRVIGLWSKGSGYQNIGDVQALRVGWRDSINLFENKAVTRNTP